MAQLRAIHRFVTIFVVLFTLFLGVTGTLIQLVDLRAVLFHYPATDANVRAMREAFDGQGDFAVRRVEDYSAQTLPAGFDYSAALAKLLRAGRAAVGDTPLAYVEFRMAGAVPVGQVGVERGHIRFDAATGATLETVKADPRENQMPASTRNTFKHLHRMTTFGDWALYINVIVAFGLAMMIVTGLLIYWKLYAVRRKIKRPGVLWSGGGAWRSLHRSISILAAAFLIVVVLSGAWLAVESLSFGFYMAAHRPAPGQPRPPGGPPKRPGNDLSRAKDAELPDMLRVSLAAARRDVPDEPIAVVRLRYYSGYPQGVIVTGGGKSQQLVYNASTGSAMSETEPNYPEVGFPFGWQAHQTAKSVHRGDYFGITGRVMDLLSGLAMIYLSVSGIVMYYTMWRKRQGAGRPSLLWK